MEAVSVDIFTAAEVTRAAASSYMKRSGSMSSFASLSLLSDEQGEEDGHCNQLLSELIVKSGRLNSSVERFEGRVISREDLIDSGEGRKTSLIKIDLTSCGNPPYQPGDHVRVFPCNVISFEALQTFIDHLNGNMSIDSHIHISFKEDGLQLSEVAAQLPVVFENLSRLVPVDHLFLKLLAILAPPSTEAFGALAQLATSEKDKARLESLSNEKSTCGIKWVDLFDHFPSLSKRVTIEVSSSVSKPGNGHLAFLASSSTSLFTFRWMREALP